MTKNGNIFVLTTFVCSAILLSGCSNVDGYGAPASDGYGVKRNTSTVEQKAITTVTINNFAFEPSVVTIAAGDSVEFVNKDGAPHTATATGFDTGRLNTGASASITIANAGTYEYICAIHPSMKGTIIVE